MPRYFFNVAGTVPFEDPTGFESANDEAAWSTAVRSTSELLRDLAGQLPSNLKIVTTVTDSLDRTVGTLRFYAEKEPGDLLC